MSNEQVAKDLEAAAKEIETRGHCQWISHHDGKICMLQSLYLGTGYQEQPGGPLVADNAARAREAEATVSNALGHSICGWNNEEGRTGAEVAAKLREIAASLTAPSAA